MMNVVVLLLITGLQCDCVETQSTEVIERLCIEKFTHEQKLAVLVEEKNAVERIIIKYAPPGQHSRNQLHSRDLTSRPNLRMDSKSMSKI